MKKNSFILLLFISIISCNSQNNELTRLFDRYGKSDVIYALYYNNYVDMPAFEDYQELNKSINNYANNSTSILRLKNKFKNDKYKNTLIMRISI